MRQNRKRQSGTGRKPTPPAGMIERRNFSANHRTFKHLTKNDRLRMERWLNEGLKPRQIADKLRVHISTVCRELKRGQYERLDGATWEMVTAYTRTSRRNGIRDTCGRKVLT